MSREQLLRLTESGVLIPDFSGVLISPEAEIEAGATIYPCTVIKGKSRICAGSAVGPCSLVERSEIGAGSVINASQVYDSKIESGVSIGPFSHIRPNCHIKSQAHVGDFVEIKNSVIGEESHIAHLTYIGDSDIGQNVNFGCGCVTVNYDGAAKGRCFVGNDAFIGCNTNLIAPVKVGDRAYIAAGSTITEDVPDDALSIARARQVNKEGRAAGRFVKVKKRN
ncbi:MAG: UDP-N-acetylglucosamine diphosphorylase [Oscillospiraceae bacterium]|nr:UDP-N-acetylglucosamine diphosphorylase [Oscillospiraceae bacterium]